MRYIYILITALTLIGCNSKSEPLDISDSDFRNAVRNGELELTKTYISQGYDISRLGMGDENALHEGILHFDVAKLLIDSGIPVNQQHKYDGSTPLIVACIAGNVEARTVELLINNRADPSVRDIHGKTALDYAKQNFRPQYKDVAEYDEKILILNKY